MKVERVKKEFEPVVITLENQLEIDALHEALGLCLFYRRESPIASYEARTIALKLIDQLPTTR